MMSLYIYKAVDDEGVPVEGTMDETSATRVTAILKERGLQVSSVQPLIKRKGLLPFQTKLTPNDLHLLNEQMLAVSRSGLPIAPALRALIKDSRNRRIESVLSKVENDLNNGLTLAEAFSAHPESFSPIYTSLIRAGEASGNLPGTLSLIAEHSGRMLDLRARCLAALAYPLVVLSVCLAVVAFLLLKVVPIFAEIFSDFGSSLPGPTRFLVTCSDLLMNGGAVAWSALVTLIASVVMLKLSRRTEPGRRITDWILVRIPFVGRMFRLTALSRFTRTLGILLNSNVPVIEALDLASAASSNAELGAAVRAASVQISNGQGMADALNEAGFFEHTFCWLLALGEERGEADQSLLQMSESYDRTLRTMDRILPGMLEPVMIILTGWIIGFVVSAMYMPLFSMGDAISGN